MPVTRHFSFQAENIPSLFREADLSGQLAKATTVWMENKLVTSYVVN